MKKRSPGAQSDPRGYTEKHWNEGGQKNRIAWLRLVGIVAPFDVAELLEVGWDSLPGDTQQRLIGKISRGSTTADAPLPVTLKVHPSLDSIIGGGADAAPAFDVRKNLRNATYKAAGLAWIVGPDNAPGMDDRIRAWRVDRKTGAVLWHGPGRIQRIDAHKDAHADYEAHRATGSGAAKPPYNVFVTLDSYELGTVTTNAGGGLDRAAADKLAAEIRAAGKYRGREVKQVIVQAQEAPEGSGAAPAWHEMADVAARAWTRAKRAERLVMLAQLAQMRWLPARLAQMLADPFTPTAIVDTEWSGLDAGLRDALAGRPGPAREVAGASGPGCLTGGGVDSPPVPPGFDLKAGIKKAFRTAPGAAWLIGADNSGHWRAWRVDDTTGALQWNGPGRTGRMVAELDALADHQAFKAPEAQAGIDFSHAAELTSPEGPAIKGGKQMKMIVHATCPPSGAGALRKGAPMKHKGKRKGGKVKASGALPELRDDVERLIDKHRILHVLEAIQEVADEKADFIIETWQDQHGARVWKQVARKVGAAGKAIQRLRAIGL